MKTILVLALTVLAIAVLPAPAAYVPWTAVQYNPVEGGNWVHIDPTQTTFEMYPVNGPAIKSVFDIKKPSDGSAKGMNAVKFLYGGQKTGHLTSTALAGSFAVINDPKDAGQVYKDILLMVAIDAASLPTGWCMTLNGTALDADDFAYVDGSALATGRPSGYYPAPEPFDTGLPGTAPARDEISHLFDKGMVSIFAFPDVNLTKTGTPLAVDYSFLDLPGDATFSAYASIGTSGIKHTNRSWDDTRVSDDLISTFSVLAPEVQVEVPEPATLTAFGLCVASAAGYIRRRR